MSVSEEYQLGKQKQTDLRNGQDRAQLLTFLLTDIEGSTRRWESDADAMRAALKVHDRTIRDNVERCGGAIFKHTGDGVCAVFASPRAAVDAAVGAERELELPVRMGIATGEAEPRDGDYFGPVLNRTARIMAAGHGGQILLDGSTVALVRGIEHTFLGACNLRDIAESVDLYQVRAPGLLTDFPPLRTSQALRGNLRVPAGAVIGRDDDVAALVEALGAHRLVTLVGVGGVGKTRLGLEVAAQVTDRFADGTWVNELAAVTDPAAVPEAVAAVLGIVQQPNMTLTDSIAAASEERSRLLVLDNCEHVLDAVADLVDAVLARSETTRILATSREGLRVPSEKLWPVSSLDTGSGADSAAVELFIERAAAVMSAPPNTSAELDTIADLCRQLDGIPLAIELAASRMQSMSVTEVRDRLNQRFRLLAGSRRGVGRHQTLRNAVQWSYDLLDDVEKSVLQRCSVFAGGFDAAAANAVGDIGDEYLTLDVLDSLVGKSLLVAAHGPRRTRFSMLETIRQFAEDQLVAAGSAQEVRAAHARYFAGQEADVIATWNSLNQSRAYDWYFLELANLRTAFGWANDNNVLDDAVDIACLAGFLGVYLEHYESVGWAEEIVDRARAVDHRRLPMLYVLAAECYAAGRIDDSVAFTAAARRVLGSPDHDAIGFDFELGLAATYMAMGRADLMVELCHAVIDRTEGPHCVARAFLVMALVMTAEPDEGIVVSDQSLAAAEASNNPAMLGWTLLARGLAYREADPGIAFDAFRRGLAVAQDGGSRLIESHIAALIGGLSAEQGQPAEAFGHLELAIRHFFDAGSLSHLCAPLGTLSTVLDRLGYAEAAATISGFADIQFTRTFQPEIDRTITHLRESLGNEGYESLAAVGESMTLAEITSYALEQVEQAQMTLTENHPDLWAGVSRSDCAVDSEA